MTGFTIFQHPHLSLNLLWYLKNIGVYRSQKQCYSHPLPIIMSRKSEERCKTTWGKSSLKKEQGTKFEIICIQHIFNFT